MIFLNNFQNSGLNTYGDCPGEVDWSSGWAEAPWQLAEGSPSPGLATSVVLRPGLEDEDEAEEALLRLSEEQAKLDLLALGVAKSHSARFLTWCITPAYMHTSLCQ